MCMPETKFAANIVNHFTEIFKWLFSLPKHIRENYILVNDVNMELFRNFLEFPPEMQSIHALSKKKNFF